MQLFPSLRHLSPHLWVTSSRSVYLAINELCIPKLNRYALFHRSSVTRVVPPDAGHMHGEHRGQERVLFRYRGLTVF